MPNLPLYAYHLAEAVNWHSIEQHGLLSTRTLLDLAEVSGKERLQLERQQRTERVILPNGVVIRDQKPMPPTALERCLEGMTPQEWYMLLNSKVFFWIDIERLNRHRRACGTLAQVVMIVDVEQLLMRYATRIALTPINTGNARRQPARRARHTFVPYTTWLESGWRIEAEALGTTLRSPSHRPVELTVADAVPDVMDFVVDVQWLEVGKEMVTR